VVVDLVALFLDEFGHLFDPLLEFAILGVDLDNDLLVS
jgi:hypothetical protein